MSLRRLFIDYPQLSKILTRFPLVHRLANRRLIEFYCGLGPPRPPKQTLASDYTSWKSLTDKTYTARQLPPEQYVREQPSIEDVAALWRRKDDQEIPSDNTSVLFAYFAQWFTDSFLRTDLTSPRKNTSNHEIDLCQIYGLTEEQTNLLRSHQDGKLRSQSINGESYLPFLFDEDVSYGKLAAVESDKDYLRLFRWADSKSTQSLARLHPIRKIRIMYRDVEPERLRKMFATGLEHGNSSIGYTAVNTIFMREHNRICDELIATDLGNTLVADEHDEYIFQLARNITLALLLKVIIVDYCKHIAGIEFPFIVDPKIGEGKNWKYTNWVGIEFNLLYRWHSMMPDKLQISGKTYDDSEYRLNPALLTELGLDATLESASYQAAGRIGLHNTHTLFFKPLPMADKDIATNSSIQSRTVQMARDARLASYNTYRKAYRLRPVRNFEEITNDREIVRELRLLYKSTDDIEFLVGLFAEKHNENGMMGELMKRMVAFDAFTHAFSNPLLAPHVYNKDSFTVHGLKIINETNSFARIVARNTKLDERRFSFNYRHARAAGQYSAHHRDNEIDKARS